MRSNAARIVVLALLLAALSVWRLPAATAQGEPIRVGVLMMLTTPLAFYGVPQLEAIKMAIEAANADGGVNGRRIELIIEDSAASNTTAVNGVNRLLQAQPVAVIGPILTTQNLVILPLIDRAGLPLLNAAAARKMTLQGSPNLFRFAGHDGVAKEVWTRFIVDKLGKRKIGIIHVANEWGYSGRDETAAALERLYGLKLASVASYQVTDKDMTGQLVQMQRDGVEVILVQGHPADETLIAKQMRQLRIQVPRIFSPSVCIAFVRGIVEFKELEGSYCESPDMLPAQHAEPAVRRWAEAFRARVGHAPEGYTLHYYELARALVTVLRRYGTEPEQIKKGLRETAFQGLAAVYQADREGNMYHQAAILQFVSGGTIRVVSRGEVRS